MERLGIEVFTEYVRGYAAGQVERSKEHDSTWVPQGAWSSYEAGWNDGYNDTPPRLELRGWAVVDVDTVPDWMEPVTPKGSSVTIFDAESGEYIGESFRSPLYAIKS
jgi:hypothetical protein